MLKDDQRLGCNQNMGFNRPMAGGLHHPNAANTEKKMARFFNRKNDGQPWNNHHWLVVWNIWIIFHILGIIWNNHPNWLGYESKVGMKSDRRIRWPAYPSDGLLFLFVNLTDKYRILKKYKNKCSRLEQESSDISGIYFLQLFLARPRKYRIIWICQRIGYSIPSYSTGWSWCSRWPWMAIIFWGRGHTLIPSLEAAQHSSPDPGCIRRRWHRWWNVDQPWANPENLQVLCEQWLLNPVGWLSVIERYTILKKKDYHNHTMGKPIDQQWVLEQMFT